VSQKSLIDLADQAHAQHDRPPCLHSTYNIFIDQSLLELVEAGISDEVASVVELAEVASKHPYYKYVQGAP
jgi:hypothetical protein